MLKSLRYLSVFIFAFVLAACYEVSEDVVVNENGGGVFESRMDMGKMLDLAQAFIGDEEMTSNGLDKPMDTVISMQSIIDSADEAQRAKIAWMKDGKVALKLNMKEKLLKIDVRIPYQNHAQLEQLMESQGTIMNNSMTGLWKSDQKTDSKPNPDDAGMNDLVGVYDIKIANGLISRKVDTVKFKEFMLKPMVSDLKKMIEQGIEITCTTNFKLPRTVKNVTNPLLKVSDDKRTVTLKYNLLEIVNDPAKFAYSIEY